MPDPDNDPTYTLDELTALADTTPRTVRYYIGEGLLPPAVSAGPKSGYTAAHLDRLRLIGRMKEAYLPLREIRQRLGGLNDAEVRETLRALAAAPATTAPAPPLNSAADYIAGLIPESGGPPSFQPPAPALHPASASGATQPSHDTWRRLPITTEAELLIRDEAYRRRADQIDALITWARRVLS
jgi:DNA-binding transcriptional MerR regulator